MHWRSRPGTDQPIPLRSGVRCLLHLGQVGLTLLPALALLLLAFVRTVQGDSATALNSGLLGLILLWPGVRSFAQAWKHRPVDILLGAEGLRVEGGLLHGQTLLWKELVQDGFCLQIIDEEREIWIDTLRPELQCEHLRLFATRQDQHKVLLFEAEENEEQLALVGLSKLLHLASGEQKSSYSRNFLGCPLCRQVIELQDLPQVRCPKCSSAIPVPPELRQRIQDGMARRGGGHWSELLQRRQRDAQAWLLGWQLMSLVVPGWLVWVMALVTAQRLHLAHHLNGAAALALFLLPVLVMLTLLSVAAGRLETRVLWRSILMGYTARFPGNPIEPYRCRSCEAPLPAGRESLVRCAYCHADNVISSTLRPPARLVSPPPSDLSSLWRTEEQRRAAAQKRVALGLAGVVFSLGLLQFGYVQARRAPRRLLELAERNPEALLLRGSALLFCTNGLNGEGVLGKWVEGDRAPQILADHLYGGQGLCRVDDVVYWTNQGSEAANWEDGSVQSLSLLPGGTVKTLAAQEHTPCALAVEGKFCYWTTSRGEVRRVSREGGRAETLVRGQSQPVALAVYQNQLYWLNAGSGAARYRDGSLCRCSLAGGQVVKLAGPITRPTALAVGDAGIFWSTRGTDGNQFSDGQVFALKGEGSRPEAVASDQEEPRNLLLMGEDLYWSNWRGGQVLHWSAATRNWETLARFRQHPGSMATDGNYLYWSETGEQRQGGSLVRFALHGPQS